MGQPVLKRTPLYETDVALDGRLVEFGGWEMPVQYPDGIMKEHLGCRNSAGLFDVSHMLGVKVTGKDRVAFMEKLCVADLAGLPDGMGSLSVITNEDGGVIDDCIVTNAGDHLYMVINAGHEDKDLPHMQKHLEKFVSDGGDAATEETPEQILAKRVKAPHSPASAGPRDDKGQRDRATLVAHLGAAQRAARVGERRGARYR